MAAYRLPLQPAGKPLVRRGKLILTLRKAQFRVVLTMWLLKLPQIQFLA